MVPISIPTHGVWRRIPVATHFCWCWVQKATDPIVIFMYVSLMVREVDHFSFIAYLKSPFGRSLLKAFCIFRNLGYLTFLLICNIFVYSGYKFFVGICIAEIFSHFVTFLFTLGGLFFLFFSRACVAFGILVPWPEIKPGPLAVKAWSPNHSTTREFPSVVSFEEKIFNFPKVHFIHFPPFLLNAFRI